MNKYLEDTNLLNYNHPIVQKLIRDRKWKNLNDHDKIQQTYLFVRDEISFGFNKNDELQSSEILKDGYGQCNTKTILLMSILRGVGISCRFHGFTINKALQKGVISGIWYKLAPKNIIHTWVEVRYKKKWQNLEGVILDKKYLNQLQKKFKNCKGNFCGYGVNTNNFQNPKIDWNNNDTYIQKWGINKDFGIFDNPDDFYKNHKQNLSFLKLIIFNLITRKSMNNNIKEVRNGSFKNQGNYK
ncbi:Transglutaminase-like superfamily protein [uncultured archaeon]|nr:Transglutaminase-like superfamily protein [uncultured archaeon]